MSGDEKGGAGGTAMSRDDEPGARPGVERMRVDRRVTLQWLAGAIAAAGAPISGAYAAPPAGAPATAQPGTAATPPLDPPAWPAPPMMRMPGPGYGTDPTMLEPVVPWGRTLSGEHLRIVAAVCDTILPAEGRHPAPSAIGIQDFVDEWVSAPYPDQQADRALIWAGLSWLEAAAKARHNGRGYAELGEPERAILLREAAKADKRGRSFLDRMKFLTTGAYYTSEAGIEELGYIGNVPLEGDYPGPTAEALAHLDRVLAGLDLTRRQEKRS